MSKFNVIKSFKILRLLEAFPSNNKELSEIEQQYFNNICNLIQEEMIGNTELVEVLIYYKEANIRQKEILKNASKKNLNEGLEYAIEIENYEIAKLIHLYI